MKKFKAYYLLLIASLTLLMLGFLAGEETFDINMHDTYFVIAHSYIFLLFFLLLFFFFTIYFSLDKAKMNLIKILYKIHVFGTLISVLGVFFPYSFFFYSTKFSLFDYPGFINICITISFLLFLFLQLLFIINIFVSLINKVKSIRTSK